MHQLKFIFVLLMVLFGLTACASSGKMAGDEMPPAVLPSKVTAVGHGAMPLGEGLSQAQRHLLAMRAAKLDAYRSLAETVAGIKIVGSSTVSAMALTSDSYKAYVEAYLRGAKIVSITPLPDGAFETILELTLGGDFYRAAPPVKEAVIAPPAAVHAPAAPTPMSVVPQPLAAQISPSQNYYLSL
ncbi:LPP20 family lipoprotein [Deefgea salmonis]|uniref:LPP20 family lipoprotein n=1 Tax=Deefgea salmonis TaxID=2875502 RepID=A0ABS8BII1_9NEIS|nr:LPP20 family lipoprotein [Deefgea salmonis]MCB5195529.1 LPP20 family lipoprotein [Deefgea salmonis]